MKVLQINSVCGKGSTGRIAIDIYDALRADGQDGAIAYGRDGAPDGVQAIKIGSTASVRLHGLLSRVTDRQGFYSHRATKKLIEDIRAYAPDIIHLHNIHGYYLHLPTLFTFLKAYDRPVVWTLHDCWAFTGHCAYFSFAGCKRWQTECKNCPQKNAYPSSLLLDRSKLNYKQKEAMFCSMSHLWLVTPSVWLRKTVEQSFLSKYPVQTIYNGIDLKVFHPVDSTFKIRYNKKDKKMVLGVANVWEPRKGLQDLLQLIARLPSDYFLVLVGLSAQQVQALPEGVLGITRTENIEELVDIYSAADVYVNTSVEETMGLTTAEALACGTPAVVYNATAVPEVVDESCGIVVSAGDIAGLTAAVQSISFSADACIKRAADFEKEKQYKQYLQLYKQVLSIKE